MYLVDHQNDIPLFSDLFNEAFHPAFKLSAELSPRHQRREIQQKDLFILQLVRHISHGDPLGQSLGNRRLADTGFTDQAGIVFLTAVQNLDDTLQLLVPSHHGIQLSGAGAGRQVDAVVVQIFPLSVFPICRRIGSRALLAGSRPLPRFPVRRILRCSGSAAVGPEGIQKLSEEGKGRGFAVLVVLRGLLRVHPHQFLHAAHGVHHLTGKIVEIFVGDSHFGQDIIHRFDVELSGAFEAEPFTLGLVSFDFCDKYHRRILSAAGADTCLHRYLSVYQLVFPSKTCACSMHGTRTAVTEVRLSGSGRSGRTLPAMCSPAYPCR